MYENDKNDNSNYFDNFQNTENFGSGGYYEPNKTPKKKKSRWPMVIAMALVFGLIAGSVTYGINYFGNKYIYNTRNVSVQPGSSDNNDLGSELQQITGEGQVSTGGTVESVAAECMPSLVTISTVSVQEMQSIFGGTQRYTAEGAGSGVIIGRNDTELLIATNNHVISGATSVSVGFVDETTAEAIVKGGDPDNDLAVVAVKLDNISDDTLSQITIATIGNSDELKLGEQVVVIGNALGYGQSVTSGYVSALNRSLTLNDNGYTFTSTGLIQTDAAINGGNSGGALFNMKGELVGINEAKSSSSSSGMIVEAMGYAIPMSKAEPILEELMNLTTREKVDSNNVGYVGIECADVTEEAAERYAMPVGVLFKEVISGGPAEAAGALKGDVLVKIDGRSITSYDDLQNELQYHSAGETLEFIVKRNDGSGNYEDVSLTITLGDRSALKSYMNSQENSESQGSDASDAQGGEQIAPTGPEEGESPSGEEQPQSSEEQDSDEKQQGHDVFSFWDW